MPIREATIADIPAIQVVRNAVRENRLSNPGLVTDQDCADMLTIRGKGWVCEIETSVIGFAIADLQGRNIWVLFLDPEFERQGIGRQLHDTMLRWYFSQTDETVWLSTSPGTRAEHFYRCAGWSETGTHGNGEIKFEISYSEWVHNLK